MMQNTKNADNKPKENVTWLSYADLKKEQENTDKNFDYVEPIDYFPKDIRKKSRIGEYTEAEDALKNERKNGEGV